MMHIGQLLPASIDRLMRSCLKLGWFLLFACTNFSLQAFPQSVEQAKNIALMGDIRIEGLRTEYLENPTGIDVLRPRLSWKLYSSGRAVLQTAFRVQVIVDSSDFGDTRKLVWDTGKVRSDQSIHLVYAGPAVESRLRYFWRVKVWVSEDKESDWSYPAFWEMGLLRGDDWIANWITQPVKGEDVPSTSTPYFRRSFQLRPGIQSARIYATSRGVYEIHLNGVRVGNRVLAPGFSSYNRRLLYQTYDVTDLLRTGDNVLGAIVGDGWYRGFLGFPGVRGVFGSRLEFLAQLEIVYENGTRELVASDQEWTVSRGPILSSDIYNGETYDARLEIPNWGAPHFDDSSWLPVSLVEDNGPHLSADLAPPVRRVDEIEPIALINTPSGGVIVDMGRNLVGWVKLYLVGDPGVVVRLKHAEALDAEGRLYTENLRTAEQTDTYILKGGEGEWFEPHFTFHGFRYVLVEGYPGQLNLNDIKAVVVNSDLDKAGIFETSDAQINQLQQNIFWSQQGNFLSIPSDCPQRDERLGWTGDAQLFFPTASFNMNVAAFFVQWLHDFRADQYKSGSVPWVIPDVLTGKNPAKTSGVPTAGVAGWSDAVIIIPWNLYLRYGDTRILVEQYASMKAWLEFAVSETDEDLVWRPSFHFGDWAGKVVTRNDLIATAYLANSANLMSQIATVIGLEEDAVIFSDLFDRLKTAFQREFVNIFGDLNSRTQTSYALALSFDLLTEDQELRAVASLIDDIRSNETHVTSGFLGTPALCPVLSDNGQSDVAYELLLQTTAPSWLAAVRAGATTMWEKWDGIENGTFADPGMNSLNHYVSGSIGQWLYETVGGIKPDPDTPGFKKTIIHPIPHPNFSHARTFLETMYGTVGTEWSLDTAGMFNLLVNIPPNANGTVHLTRTSTDGVLESGLPLHEASGVTAVRGDDRVVEVDIGSGVYQFSYKLLPKRSIVRSTPIWKRAAVFLFLFLLLVVLVATAYAFWIKRPRRLS